MLVTGVCGNLGRRVARHLHRDMRVVGLDRRKFPGKPKDIEHYPSRSPASPRRGHFPRRCPIKAVVHLGVMHNPRGNREEHHAWNVAGLSKLLEYASRHRVRKFVLLSSANVYGPRPDNAQFLNEDAPLLAAGAFSDMRDLVELDMLVQSFFWKYPEIETVILRPTHILGTVHNAPSNYLRLKVAPTLMGFDPMLQTVHQDDVVRGDSAVSAAGHPWYLQHGRPAGLAALRDPGEARSSPCAHSVHARARLGCVDFGACA